MKILIPLVFLLALHASQQAQVEYSSYSDVIDITTGTPALADSLFRFISTGLPFITYDDCNNCDSRAHLTAAILEKQFPGVSIAKAWLFADYKRSTKSAVYRLKPQVHLSYNDDCDKWGYHVAPLVIISGTAGTDTLVLDPSTQTRAVNLNKWASDLLPVEGAAFLVIKDKRYRSFPDNEEGKFLDDMKDWRDDESLVDEDYSKSINNILLAKYGFWEPWTYRMHYNRIKDLLE
jgi:hypothetical protein